jgi:hypothetical protein
MYSRKTVVALKEIPVKTPRQPGAARCFSGRAHLLVDAGGTVLVEAHAIKLPQVPGLPAGFAAAGRSSFRNVGGLIETAAQWTQAGAAQSGHQHDAAVGPAR